MQKLHLAVGRIHFGQLGVGREGDAHNGGVGIKAHGTVGRDKVIGFKPFAAVKHIAGKVVHHINHPHRFVFRAVVIFIIGAGDDAAGEFKAPFAEIGFRAFGVKIQLAHAIGNQMAVKLLLGAIVDAYAV